MRFTLFLTCITAMISCSCYTTSKEYISNQFRLFRPNALGINTPETIDGYRRIYLSASVDENSVDPIITELALPSDSLKGFILEINSGGGIVDDGFRLVKAIENSKIPVHCYVDGEAMSMAYYILQSCSTRYMTKRSVLMIHGPSISSQNGGNANEWLETGEYLQTLQNAMIEHCVSRMKISAKEMQDKISTRAWYMTWEEALRVGAVDGLVKNFDEVLQKTKGQQTK